MNMKRRRTLITSPLEWQMMAAPVPAPRIPVLAEEIVRNSVESQRPSTVISYATAPAGATAFFAAAFASELNSDGISR